MSKCKLHKCNAACCFNVPLPIGMVEQFADKIVTPVIARECVPPSSKDLPLSEIAYTSEDLARNRCPFLRHDFKCNIYEDRPKICRIFGEIEELKCKFRK